MMKMSETISVKHPAEKWKMRKVPRELIRTISLIIYDLFDALVDSIDADDISLDDEKAFRQHGLKVIKMIQNKLQAKKLKVLSDSEGKENLEGSAYQLLDAASGTIHSKASATSLDGDEEKVDHDVLDNPQVNKHALDDARDWLIWSLELPDSE